MSSLNIAGGSSHKGIVLPHPIFLRSLLGWRRPLLNSTCASSPSTSRFRHTPYHLLCGNCADRHWRLSLSSLLTRPGNFDRVPLPFGVILGWCGSTRLESKVAAQMSYVPLPYRTRGARSSRNTLLCFSGRVLFRLSGNTLNLPITQVDVWHRLWQE